MKTIKPFNKRVMSLVTVTNISYVYNMKSKCMLCNKSIVGREDKKYCSANCRAKHYRQRTSEGGAVSNINFILNKNHKILSDIFKETNSKQLSIAKHTLARKGFNFDYCTRVYLNSKGKWYKYIYDFRWIEFSDQRVRLYKD